MIKTELEDRIIYRAEKDKKVKFVGSEVLYSEISVDNGDTREVEEVNNGNIR